MCHTHTPAAAAAPRQACGLTPLYYSVFVLRGEVVDAFDKVHRSGRYRVQIKTAGISAHHVASRIMRKDNYIIAMINKRVLDMSVRTLRLISIWLHAQSVLRHLTRRNHPPP